jgi:hypothetical protein
MLRYVISGGQTRGDQAALLAARRYGIEIGGWAPLGWMTEDGPAPWLADFGLVECPEPGYPARTEANVLAAGATFWFGSLDTAGYRATAAAIRKHRKSLDVIQPGASRRPSDVKLWLSITKVQVINIAGNRESLSPGIGARVERFLRQLFHQLGHERG